ncbi:hypothetical protein A1OS_09505 [Enterovibrio norvegicus]|nr:hypothetical protein A1OS_09505 [Enterovibrio norvegicus]
MGVRETDDESNGEKHASVRIDFSIIRVQHADYENTLSCPFKIKATVMWNREDSSLIKKDSAL